jgi:hypothetical protein
VKTLVLMMVAISGLNPTQKMRIVDAHNNPIGVYQILPTKPSRCAPSFPLARPLIADQQGGVQFCIEPVQDYRIEIVKTAKND